MQRILEVYDRSIFEITPGFIVVSFPYAVDFERSMSEDLSEDLSEDTVGRKKAYGEICRNGKALSGVVMQQ